MHVMETKMDEMFIMISGLVAAAPTIVVGAEENIVNTDNDNSKGVDYPLEPTELSSTSP